MTKYTFYINGDFKTVEADIEEGAIKEAGIEKRDAYAISLSRETSSSSLTERQQVLIWSLRGRHVLY